MTTPSTIPSCSKAAHCASASPGATKKGSPRILNRFCSSTLSLEELR